MPYPQQSSTRPAPVNSIQSTEDEGPVVLPEGMRIPMPDSMERSLGRATKFMSKKAWMKALMGVQMALASYGMLEPTHAHAVVAVPVCVCVRAFVIYF